MANSGKGLAAIALIIGLLGAGAGGFFIIDKYVLSQPEPEPEPYVLPMARVYCNKANYFLSSGDHHVINFTQATYDTYNAFNFTGDAYVIPETGFYEVYGQISIDVEIEDFFKVYIRKNGSTESVASHTAAADPNTFTANVFDILNFTVGDEISLYVYSYNSGSFDRQIFANEDYTYLTIAKFA